MSSPYSSNTNIGTSPDALYPVVQDLTEVETNGCCCLDSDGSLSIGAFNFRDLSLLPTSMSRTLSEAAAASEESEVREDEVGSPFRERRPSSLHGALPFLGQSLSEDAEELRKKKHRRGFSLSLKRGMPPAHRRNMTSDACEFGGFGVIDGSHPSHSICTEEGVEEVTSRLLLVPPTPASPEPTFEEQYVLTRLVRSFEAEAYSATAFCLFVRLTENTAHE